MSSEASRTPVTLPTPENVAESLTSGDNDYHDGNDWWTGLSAVGNVLDVTITPCDEDGEQCEKVAFRAVVAEVSEETFRDGPLAVQLPPDGGVRLEWLYSPDLLSPELAYEAAAQLIAAAALAQQKAGGAA